MTKKRKYKKREFVKPGDIVNDYKIIKSDRDDKGALVWVAECLTCGETVTKRIGILRNHKSCTCGIRARTAHQLQDITGQVFGRLTVTAYAGQKNTDSTWRCRCTCGGETVVRRRALITGDTISCGCAKKEQDSINLQKGREHVEENLLVGGTFISILDRKPTKGRDLPKGVTFRRKRKVYEARIMLKDVHYFIGTYKDVATAERARKIAEEILYKPVLEGEMPEVWDRQALRDEIQKRLNK